MTSNAQTIKENIEKLDSIKMKNFMHQKTLLSDMREDSRVGSTRNLSVHLDNNCIGRNGQVEPFWNSGVYLKVCSFQGGGMDGKSCLISTFNWWLLISSHGRKLFTYSWNNLLVDCGSQGRLRPSNIEDLCSHHCSLLLIVEVQTQKQAAIVTSFTSTVAISFS